jgi:hypothetical protein
MFSGCGNNFEKIRAVYYMYLHIKTNHQLAGLKIYEINGLVDIILRRFGL